MKTFRTENADTALKIAKALVRAGFKAAVNAKWLRTNCDSITYDRICQSLLVSGKISR